MKKQTVIEEELKQRVRTGFYPPGVRLPSEAEMAEELGVNKITVNKAVNRLIAQQWLQRGKSTRDGTYVNDPQNRVRGTFGVLIRCSNTYSYQLLNGLSDGASRNGYLLSALFPTPEELPQAVRKITSGGIQGLFIVGYSEIHWKDVPAVYIDCGLYSAENIIHLSADVYAGSREMAEAFFNAGHRNLAFCMYSSFPICDNRRCAAFLDVMREHGVENPEKHFFYTNNSTPERIIRQIFRTFPDTSVIVGENDIQTHHLYCAMRPPLPARDRIQFAGFGNLPEVQELHPFPTVDQHPYEIGIRAVEKLIACAGPLSTGGDYEQTPTSLVHREMIVPPFTATLR